MAFPARIMPRRCDKVKHPDATTPPGGKSSGASIKPARLASTATHNGKCNTMTHDNLGVADKRDLGAFIPSELDDAGLDPYTFRVYCRIARRVSCWESEASMAKGCGMSVRKLEHCINELVERGMVERERRPGESSLLRLLPLSESTGYARGAEVPTHVVRRGYARGAHKGTPRRVSLEGKPLAPAEPTRARDELFEAVVEVSGWKLEALTKSARGRANTAVKELREVGAGPDDVRAAAKVYARKWPDMELTPTALAANWTTLGSTNGNGQVRAGPSCQWCDVALARHDDEGCLEIRKINGWN